MSLAATRDPRPAAPAGLLLLHRHSLVNVLVIGRSRTWRIGCATEFHAASPLGSGPLVRLDCAMQAGLAHRALEAWSLHSAGPAVHPLWPAARGALALDRVTRLAPASQRLLHSLLCRHRGRDGSPFPGCGRLIAMSEEPPERAVERGDFSAALLDCLDKVRVIAQRSGLHIEHSSSRRPPPSTRQGPPCPSS